MLVVIAAAWLVSLALPALELPGGSSYTGLELLRRGWQAGRAGVFAWYANPLFVCAALLGAIGFRRLAGVVSGVAFVLGLTSLAAVPIARSGGAPVPDVGWAAGFYLWLAALAALTAWSWLAVVVDAAKPGRNPPRATNSSHEWD